MTDHLTDEAVKALLDGATPGPWRADGEPWNRVVWSSAENRVCFMSHSNGLDDARDIATSELVASAPNLARTVIALHAELAQARADAKAAQALVLEEATKRLAAARETFCYASPGSDEEFTSLLLGFDTAAGIIRDLAPDAGTAELAKLRGERDALLDAVQANMLRPDYLRAERAEAERDRLAAELAAANAREAGLRNFVEDFAAAKIDALRFPRPLSPEDELDPVVEAEEVWAWQADARAALAQPSTEGGE